jgi:hypothetical protein
MKKLIVSAVVITVTMFACKTGEKATTTAKKPTLDCTNKSYTYEADIKPIMDQYCTRCHNTNLKAGFNFEDVTYVKKAAVSGQLLGSIKHGEGFDPMPAALGGQMLDQAIIDKVECWVNNGMK